jgi:hypothetical protein
LPEGGARVRRGRGPGAGVPGGHGGDRRVRPAQGLAAGKVKGKPVRVVEYPDAVHGFYVFPDSGKLVEEVKLFVVDDEHRS